MAKYAWHEPRPPRDLELRETADQRWTRKLATARARVANGIPVGRAASGIPVFITPEQLQTHMQVVGSTGVGKSYFLEGLVKTLILQGHGIALIDPHGDLYHRVLDFCAAVHQRDPTLRLAERVIPFDVAETRHILGFNPIARNARVMTYQVVALMEAVRKCWGQATFFETPRLARWLFNTAYALIDSGQTFIQAYHLVNPTTPNPYRRGIVAQIHNPRIKAEWDWLCSLKSVPQEERVESTLNRIKPFVEHQVLRHIVGQQSNTLDFPDVLANRNILLVNLAKQNVISEDDQHLLGTLLVNELLTAAFARPQGQRSPFFLFLDEFQHFVTKDVCEILDGGRKFGLHLVLAHQHLHQLLEKDPEVYYSALTNARTKVVFGGLIDEDLEVLAKELYTGEFDPDEIKNEIWQTKFRPVESSRVVSSWSSGRGSGSVNHESFVTGQSFVPGSDFWSPGTTTSSSVSGHGTGRQESSVDSQSESRVPFYEFHEFRELSSRTFRSLEEQLYIKKAQLKRRGRQYAAVLVPDMPVQVIKTPTIREVHITDRERQEFRQACFAASGCFKTPEDADREVQALEERLLLHDKATIELLPAKTLTQAPKQRRRSPLDDVIGRE